MNLSSPLPLASLPLAIITPQPLGQPSNPEVQTDTKEQSAAPVPEVAISLPGMMPQTQAQVPHSPPAMGGGTLIIPRAIKFSPTVDQRRLRPDSLRRIETSSTLNLQSIQFPECYLNWKLVHLTHMPQPLNMNLCKELAKCNKIVQSKKYTFFFNAVTVCGVFDSLVDPLSKRIAIFCGASPDDDWTIAGISTCIKGTAKGIAGFFAWKHFKTHEKVSARIRDIMKSLQEDYQNIAQAILYQYRLETANAVVTQNADLDDLKMIQAGWKRKMQTVKTAKLHEFRKELVEMGVTEKQATEMINPLLHAIAIINLPTESDPADDNIMKVIWQKIKQKSFRAIRREAASHSREVSRAPSEAFLRVRSADQEDPSRSTSRAVVRQAEDNKQFEDPAQGDRKE